MIVFLSGRSCVRQAGTPAHGASTKQRGESHAPLSVATTQRADPSEQELSRSSRRTITNPLPTTTRHRSLTSKEDRDHRKTSDSVGWQGPRPHSFTKVITFSFFLSRVEDVAEAIEAEGGADQLVVELGEPVDDVD